MNLRIRFVRLQRSELIREAIEDRIHPVLEKFELDLNHNAYFDVEMENSPHQTGPAFFKIKMRMNGPSLKNFHIEKSDINFYRALSSLATSLPSQIKQFQSKRRSKAMRKEREIKNAANF